MQLRKLKDDSGLSLSRLAAKTGYSASSWERYFVGKTVAPAAAVEALAALVGADPVRVEALREAAARAVPQPQPDVETPDDPPEPAVGPSRARRFGRTALTAGAGALLGAAVMLLALWPKAFDAKKQALVVRPQAAYTCAYTQRAGLWYAGNSPTTTAFLEVDMWGPVVAELQCLLQHAGFSPGAVDGNFGPLTETAVLDAQKAHHLDIDGRVGPQTWAALRG